MLDIDEVRLVRLSNYHLYFPCLLYLKYFSPKMDKNFKNKRGYDYG